MASKILKPGEVFNIPSINTILVQNLDEYKRLDFSKTNLVGKWFEVEPRAFYKIEGPIYVKNSNKLSSLELIYEDL